MNRSDNIRHPVLWRRRRGSETPRSSIDLSELSAQVSLGARSQASTYAKIAGRRVAVNVVTFRRVQEPRLRFDRVAIELVRRLQASLSKSVPDDKTVIVTITAPIRQDSKTGAALQNRIRELLAARRTQLKATIYGNRIQVRVLKGGASRTSKLIGFVHNPKPDPLVLFNVARSLLASIGSGKRPLRGDRWLIIANQDRLAPFETVRQVCLALRARTVFKRILLAESEGARVL
jgi:hypothetical protein